MIKTCCPTHSLRTSVSGLEELEKSYLPGLAFAFAFGNGIDRALDSTVKEAWALGPGHVHLIDSEIGQQAVQDIIPIILGPA